MNPLFPSRTNVLLASVCLQLGCSCSVSEGAAGRVDLSFHAGMGANGPIEAIAIQPDGKVLIGGPLTFIHGTNRYASARFHPDGTPDSTFVPASFEPIVGDLGVPHDPSEYYDTADFTAFALQPDGRVLVAGVATRWDCTDEVGCIYSGDFLFVSRHHADGSRDPSFAPAVGYRFNGGDPLGRVETVHALAVEPDGRILVGGYFHAVNGTRRNGLARLNTNGTLDTTASLDISSDSSFTVVALASQPDGKFFAGGKRFLSDGSPDLGFAAVDGVSSVVLQPDGKVILGGTFTTVHGSNRNRIARLHPDGSLDTRFNPGTGANATVRSIALQPDGRIVVGGAFTEINDTLRNRVARLNADGTLDGGFIPEPALGPAPKTLALQPDGKVLVGGPLVVGDPWYGPLGDVLAFVNGTNQHGRMRLYGNGQVDRGFVSSPFYPPLNWFYGNDCLGDPRFGCSQGSVTTAQLTLASGKVLLCGYSVTTITGDETLVQIVHPFLARLDATGAIEHSFDWLTNAYEINALVQQPDGRILVGGYFYKPGTNYGVVRILPDDTLDETFQMGEGLNTYYGDRVTCLASQPDGKVLYGGSFGVARLNRDGSRDACFNPGLRNGAVHALAVQPDGRILAAGSFTTANGIGRNGIARIHPDGSLDGSFDPGRGPNGPVHSVVLQPDGNLLIGGEFSEVDGVPRPFVARLFGTDAGPSLRLIRAADDTVVAAWPGPSTGFTLQQNSQLALDGWTDVGIAPTTVGSEQRVSLVSLDGLQFLRLSGGTPDFPNYPVPPPVAPQATTVIAGNREISMSWSAFAGALEHRVQRSTRYEGPYTTVAHTATNHFTDTNLVNGTLYYYVVSTVYPCGESAMSTPFSKAPQKPAPSVHVESITLRWVASGGGYKARAVVKVVDDAGVPLGAEAGAVLGEFSGALTESNRFGYTADNGNATVTSTSAIQEGSVTFTVTAVNTYGLFVYNPASNLVSSATITR